VMRYLAGIILVEAAVSALVYVAARAFFAF
jgi:hypothetical protein